MENNFLARGDSRVKLIYLHLKFNWTTPKLGTNQRFSLSLWPTMVKSYSYIIPCSVLPKINFNNIFLQVLSDILLVDEGDDVIITPEVLYADSLLHHRFLFQVRLVITCVHNFSHSIFISWFFSSFILGSITAAAWVTDIT